MLKIFFLFCAFLFGAGESAFAGLSAGQACGINDQCNDGLVCLGIYKDAQSGTCSYNGVSVVLCRVNDYVAGKLGKTFLIFALVMIGVAFFLGKVSWGMIVSVLLGAGFMYGGTKLVMQVSGTDEDFCSASDTIDCLNKGGYVTENTIRNTTNIYNSQIIKNPIDPLQASNPNKQDCPILGCIKMNCPKLTRPVINATDLTACANPGGVLDLSKTAVEAVWLQIGVTSRSGCSTPCVLYPAAEPRDYFLCTNTCTGQKFAIDAPSSKGYQDCSAALGVGQV